MVLMHKFSTAWRHSPRSAIAAQNSQVFRMLRLIRLVRVARTARILHSVPELVVLAGGMLAGMRSTVAVMCLLLLFIYVFAVVFTMLIGSDVFANVPMSMNTLMLQVIVGPDVSVMNSLL